MAKVLINDSTLSNMADEIRSQKGTQNAMTPDEMVTEVANIGESATAIASDIANGKTAITSSGLVTGTNTNNVSVGSFTGISDALGGNMVSLLSRAITKVDNVDFSTITDFRYLFSSCNSLTPIPLIDTSNATDLTGMFIYCTSITSIPLLNTENVTIMNQMFASCIKLTTVPLFDTQNVTKMASMFSGCSKLTSVPLFNTQNVTDMSNMFNYCKDIRNIPLFDTRNATNMAYMFFGCENQLTSIPLFDTQNVTNMSYMFRRCLVLTTMPQFDTSSVTNGGLQNMFQYCNALTNDSLNNILAMCANASLITTNKTLKYIGLSSTQANTCTGLSNYSAFTSAGWTTGY